MSPHRNIKPGITSLKIIQEITEGHKINVNSKNLNKNGGKLWIKNENMNVINK
jgi:hypothetical protein